MLKALLLFLALSMPLVHDDPIVVGDRVRVMTIAPQPEGTVTNIVKFKSSATFYVVHIPDEHNPHKFVASNWVERRRGKQ